MMLHHGQRLLRARQRAALLLAGAPMALGVCDTLPGEHGAGACLPAVATLPDPTSAAPFWLSQTGLYCDVQLKGVAPDLLELEPAFALWSDGAEKRRWLRLPPGTRIDNRDPDHWQFPVGAMLFKEFALEGRRLETRLIVRTGSGPRDYWMGSFAWNDDESDARFVPEGLADVRGTEHDVPNVDQCGTCHNGEPGRVLGISAVQQPALPAELLTEAHTPFAPTEKLAGDMAGADDAGAEVATPALGYLHANCAHCHNPMGSARPDTDMNLRLSVRDRALGDTGAYRTAVGRHLQSFKGSSVRLRVAPGAPEDSGLLYRMTERRPEAQMPPLGTSHADEAGVALIRSWIESL